MIWAYQVDRKQKKTKFAGEKKHSPFLEKCMRKVGKPGEKQKRSAQKTG